MTKIAAVVVTYENSKQISVRYAIKSGMREYGQEVMKQYVQRQLSAKPKESIH